MSRLLRALPWISVAAFAAGSLLWLSSDRRIPRKAFVDYSVYNTSGKGLSLAYRYLEATGRAPSVLLKRVEASSVPPAAVLLRIRPERESAEPPAAPAAAGYPFTAAEEEWMRGGGRLVLALDRSQGAIGVRDRSEPGVPRKVFPDWAGVERLDPPMSRALSSLPPGGGHALFAAGDDALIVRRPQGAGELVLCSLPELFRNDQIGRGDHLALLERLAGTGRPVLFDERIHGMEGDSGVLDILRIWGFGPFLVLIVVASAVSFWRQRVRVGPEEDDAREQRVEAVDFVDSLALLYHRMLPRRHALALYLRSFDQSVAVQTGLRDAALEARIREFLPRRPLPSAKGRDMSVQEFGVALEIVNQAFGRLNDAKRSGRGRPAAAGARRT